MFKYLYKSTSYKYRFLNEIFIILFLLKILFILDRGDGREKERKRNINVWLLLAHPLLGTWPATQACTLTGNRTGDPLICRSALNHWATPARTISDDFVGQEFQEDWLGDFASCGVAQWCSVGDWSCLVGLRWLCSCTSCLVRCWAKPLSLHVISKPFHMISSSG